MKSLLFIAITGVKNRLNRTVILLLVVTLGVTLMVSMQIAFATIRDAQSLIDEGTEIYADWILESEHTDSAFATQNTIRLIHELPGVESVMLRKTALVQIDLDGTVQSGILFGAEPQGEQTWGSLRLEEGELPGPQHPGVAIRGDLARRLGVHLGDRVTVSREQDSIRWPIVGFLGPEGIGGAEGAIGVTVERSMMDSVGWLPSTAKILVRLQHGSSPESWLREHKQLFQSKGLQAREPYSYVNKAPIYTILSIASFLGPAFCMILIHSSFSIVMRQREHELHLWKIVGATRKQLRGILLLEGAAIGSLGGLAGCGIGAAIAKLIVHYIASMELFKYHTPPTVPLSVGVMTVVLSVVVGSLVTVVAAFPLIIKGKQHNSTSELGYLSSAPLSLMKYWFWICFCILLASLSYLITGPVGLLLGFISFLCLMPLLTYVIDFLSRRFPQFDGSYGAVISLGIQRVKEHRKLTVGSAKALMLATGFIVGFYAVNSAAWENTQDAILAEKSDLYIYGLIDKDMQSGISHFDGLNGAQFFYNTGVAIRNNGLTGTAFDVKDALPFSLKEGNEPSALAAMREGKSILIGNVLAKQYNLHVGDDMELQLGERNEKFQIAGIVPQIWDDSATLWFNSKDVQDRILNKAATSAFIRLSSSTNAELFIKQLRAVYPSLHVESKHARLQNNKKLNSEKMNVPMTLLYLLAAFSIISIIQTSLLTVIEQKRELALFRAAGATIKQIVILVLLQASFAAIVGAVLGGVGGRLIGDHLVRVISAVYRADLTGGLSQWYIPVLAAIVLAIIAAIPAVMWSAKQSVAETLRQE